MPPKEERATTINEQTKLPLSIVFTFIGVVAVVVACWADLRHQLGSAVTLPQLQEWLDTAREQNPNIHWPRIPQKQNNQSAEYQWQPIYLTRKDNE